MGGGVDWVEVGVWQILRMLSAWVGELGLFWILLMIRLGSRADWVTLQVGAVLPEDVQAKGWRFSLLSEVRGMLGSLLGERAWVQMVWSEFGSELRSGVRSELGLGLRFEFALAPKGGVVGFPMAEADFGLRSQFI